MNHSMPGLPVHHQLLEFTQTHVHWVSDAIQPLKGRHNYFGEFEDSYLFSLGCVIMLLSTLWERPKNSSSLFIKVKWMSWDLTPKTILSSHWHKAFLITERNVLVHYFRKGCQKETVDLKQQFTHFLGCWSVLYVSFGLHCLTCRIWLSKGKHTLASNSACSFKWWDYSREMILLWVKSGLQTMLISLSYHSKLCMYKPLHICKISIGTVWNWYSAVSFFSWLAKLEFHIVQSNTSTFIIPLWKATCHGWKHIGFRVIGLGSCPNNVTCVLGDLYKSFRDWTVTCGNKEKSNS